MAYQNENQNMPVPPPYGQVPVAPPSYGQNQYQQQPQQYPSMDQSPQQYQQYQPQYPTHTPAPVPQKYTPYGVAAPQQGFDPVTAPDTPILASGHGGNEGMDLDFQQGQWRDIGFLFLFLAHLAGMLAVAGMYGPEAIKRLQEVAPTPSSVNPDAITSDGHQLMYSLLAAALAAGVFAALWLAVLKACADTIIKLSLLMNVVFLGAAAMAAAYAGSVWMAVVFVVFAGMAMLYYYVVRARIPFTQAIIKASVQSLEKHSGPVFFSYVLVVFQVAWMGFWSFCTLALYYHLNPDPNATANNFSLFVYFLLLLSLYWTAQVLKNIGHVTTAGTVATWWLADERNACCGSFKRATTTSLGSICFGSLIVAFLQALRAVLRVARDAARRSENGAASCVLCCVDCWLGLLERAIEFFNKYAYTQVAIYGKDFRTASKDTWTLFKARGFDVLINSDLTGMVLTLGMLLGGVVSAGSGGAIAYVYGHDNQAWTAITAVAFMVGMLMTALVMTVVDSAVATTYVLWAQCPDEIARSRPIQYNNINAAARQLHPSMML